MQIKRIQIKNFHLKKIFQKVLEKSSKNIVIIANVMYRKREKLEMLLASAIWVPQVPVENLCLQSCLGSGFHEVGHTDHVIPSIVRLINSISLILSIVVH